MKIKFKKEVEKEFMKLMEGLKKIGIHAEIPSINMEVREENYVGKMLPEFFMLPKATIELIIPEELVEMK